MEAEKDSRIIQFIALIGDILILYIVFAVIFATGQIISSWSLVQHTVLISFTYYTSVTFFGGILLHRRRVRADQIIGMVIRNFVGFLVIWNTLLFVTGGISHLFSWHIILFILISFILVVGSRILFQSILRGMRKSGKSTCKVVFVGSTQNMVELYDEMEKNLLTGYKVVGYFDTEKNPNFPAPYLGNCDEVTSYLQQNQVQRLYCCLPSAMSETILSIITFCENHLIRFFSVPNLRNYLQRKVTLEMFSNTPLLSICQEPLLQLDNRCIKRSFDIAVSAIFLCTIFPFIWLVFGILIKLSSPGKIFFRQKRTGLDGKEFWCYKFRSMRENASSDSQQATQNDPRKTKVGDFMRRTSIDELPQFFNVLKGDMSIVGPRPHMLKHTEDYSHLINAYMLRHLVKPGVTGWAQVTGFRGETKHLSEMQGRVKADIWYMENWSFILDLYIMYKTVANVIEKKDDKAF